MTWSEILVNLDLIKTIVFWVWLPIITLGALYGFYGLLKLFLIDGIKELWIYHKTKEGKE